MEIKQVFSGKTVEEAVENGLKELGATRDEVEIVVLEEGKKKLFGSVPARVEITKKDRRTDGERAVDFLKGLFPFLGVQAETVLRNEEEKIEIELKADNSRGIIGRRGEIIDAIQVLAGAVANTGRDHYKRVVVDYGNYREDREETLRRVAEKLAAKAVRLGKRVRLEPMNPYERRIIHAALVDNEEVTTKSEGSEPARYVVIVPKNLKPYDNRDRNGRGKREGGRDGKRDFRGKRDGKFGEKRYPKRELPKEGTPESSGTSFNRESSSGYKKGSFNGFFGTFLGNSREDAEQTTDQTTEQKDDE